MNKRTAVISYKAIQQQMFFYYPIYCRLKLRSNKRKGFSWVEGELEVGYAFNEMQDSFRHPVEEMMLKVAVLVLAAGREPKDAYDITSADIKKMIALHGLDSLLAQLSEDDARVVRSDLELLGILEDFGQG